MTKDTLNFEELKELVGVAHTGGKHHEKEKDAESVSSVAEAETV